MFNPMKFTQSLIDHGMREWIERKQNAVFEGWCYRLRPGAIDLAANVSQFSGFGEEMGQFRINATGLLGSLHQNHVV